MKNINVYTSQTVSKLIDMPYLQEPNSGTSLLESKRGIFIGNSSKMNMPIFIDFNSLFNPHIFIVGMTGSGKTYLMKSMLIRLHLVLGAAVIILDMTGEYADIAYSLNASPSNPQELRTAEDLGLCTTTYVSLKEMKEEDKTTCASKILKLIAVKMRKNSGKEPKPTFVLLDESWKLLDRNEDLEILIREGRKYGVGLLLASQLLEDMKNEIVSNSASIFIFRMQVKQSAEKAAMNYNLDQEYLEAIQGLSQGSCLLIKLDKNSKREITVIRKVIGISINPKTKVNIGGRMEIEIDTEKLQDTILKLCGADAGKTAISSVSSSPNLRLSDLISYLIEGGANRRAILSEFRKLRVSDSDLADAFSESIERLSIGAIDEKTL